MEKPKKVFEFAVDGVQFRVDERARTMHRNGQEVFPRAKDLKTLDWQPASFNLLCTFLRDRNIPISIKLYSRVSRLKRLLGNEGQHCIKKGDNKYRWLPEVQTLEPNDDDAAQDELSRNSRLHQVLTEPNASIEKTSDVTKEIARLGNRPAKQRQTEAITETLLACRDTLRQIHAGQIPIPGREDRYFERFFAYIESSQEQQLVRAFIRLAAFDPDKLVEKSWFHDVYERLEKEVQSGRVVIEYIFLLRSHELSEKETNFIGRYEKFAKRICVVSEQDTRYEPGTLRPSVILFEKKRIAFTHDRGEDSTLTDIKELILPELFQFQRKRYERIKSFSRCVFPCPPATDQSSVGARGIADHRSE